MKTIAKKSLALALAAGISFGAMAQLNMRVTQQAEATLRLQHQQRLMERSGELVRQQANAAREAALRTNAQLQTRVRNTGSKVKAGAEANVDRTAEKLETTRAGSKKEIRQLKREARKQRKLEARASANYETQISREPGRMSGSTSNHASGLVDY